MSKLRAVEEEQPVVALGGGDGGGPEDPHARFRRVAGRRVRAVLNSMRILDKMTGNASYYANFPQEDVDKMFEAMRAMMDKVQQRMQQKKPDPVDFEF